MVKKVMILLVTLSISISCLAKSIELIEVPINKGAIVGKTLNPFD